MDAVFLVDGSGYIFRAYYAVQPLSNSKGFPTNGLLGFTRMLLKLIREAKATHLAVMFDTGEKTFRHDLYPEYKANRAECPEDLKPQMPYFRKIVEALGIKSLEKPGVEADDIIATLARRLAAKGHKVVIVSGDKDLLQLVNGQIEVWDALRDAQFTPEMVQEKFGVKPEQIKDYLALIGDSSDNVPGVKGIGPKTAEKLMESFGSIDSMLENPQKIEEVIDLRGAKGIRQKIESGASQLRLSQKLVALDEDVGPFNQLDSVEEFCLHPPQPEIIEPLFSELEFGRLLESVVGSGNGTHSDIPSIYKNKNYEIVTAESLTTVTNRISEYSEFAFDTETSSLDPLNCELVGISISCAPNQAYYFPLAGKVETERNLNPVVVKQMLGPIFSNPRIKKIGLNLKFDISVLEEQGYRINGALFDDMICSHLLNPDRRQHGLKTLAQQYLSERMLTYEELVQDKSNIADVPLDDLANYACHDADASLILKSKLEVELGFTPVEEVSLRRAFELVEMPLIPVLSKMERVGIKVDLPYLEELGLEFVGEMKALETQIHQLAGVEFNLNSPKQLGAVLFDTLGLPTAGVKKNQNGFSTDASVLSRLAGEHQIAAKLLEYRELHKLNSTYVEALRRLVHPKTGRIHSSFNQAIAATGRLSSTDPNLQNIPIRTSQGRRLRRAFIAEEGNLLLSADYSQIELRLLAHLSDDNNLKQAFIDGEDIHLRTAKEIFGPLACAGSQQKELRRVAKTINFGLIYGMGAFRLAGELGVTRKQAQQYIDSYFARYPKVLKYFERLKEDIESLGYVETIYGRRRYLREVDTSGRDAGYAERSLINAPIQGTAAEVIKLAMIRLHTVLGEFSAKARLVLQVHDELVFEVDSGELPKIIPLVVREMEAAMSLSVPLKVDVRSGISWGEDV